MEVDLEKRTIRWIVNGKKEAEVKCPPMLIGSEKYFVPFVSMFNTGDIVDIRE